MAVDDGAKGTPLVTPLLQLYEVAPVPVKVTDEPAQIAVEGEADEPTIGGALFELSDSAPAFCSAAIGALLSAFIYSRPLMVDLEEVSKKQF